MIYQTVTASVLMTFFNIGVIGALQRLMHLLDMDIDAKHAYPWRTELVYAGYEIVIAAVLLAIARPASGFIQAMVVDCQLLVVLHFTNALKTLPAILTTVIANFALFAGLMDEASWPLSLAVAVYLLWLVGQEIYASPFDEHMTLRVLTTLAAGGGFWVLVRERWALSPQLQAVMMTSFLIATIASYTYMMLLRREHLIDRQNARDVRYDGLTDAYNWLSFRTALTHRFAKQTLSLLAIDIDQFKEVNTQYGHPTGNQVLIAFAAALQAQLEVSSADAMLARTGGEEFMAILPDCDAATARAVARACQARIRDLLVPLEDGDAIRVTATIGIATTAPSDASARDLYRRADAQLQAAKAAGRDRLGTEG